MLPRGAARSASALHSWRVHAANAPVQRREEPGAEPAQEDYMNTDIDQKLAQLTQQQSPEQPEVATPNRDTSLTVLPQALPWIRPSTARR